MSGNLNVQGRVLKTVKDSAVLDAIDFEILNLLQENSKQTYAGIGKQLGISHSTVYDRIKKMDQNGIVTKYTIVIDYERIGLKNIMALMTVYTDPKESETVSKKLSSAPEVLEVYTSLSEELLIIAKVVAENQESLHAFIANHVAPLPGVLRIRTSIITRKYKETLPAIIKIAGKSSL